MCDHLGHVLRLTSLLAFIGLARAEPAFIHSPPTVAPTNHPACDRTYRVRPGDDKYRIARRLGTTTKRLQAANPSVDLRHLKPGQLLVNPVKPELRKPSQPEDPEVLNPLALAPWSVQPGDTAQSLAKHFGVATRQLQAANPGVDWHRLKPGQTVLISGYGWRCLVTTNATCLATHQQLGLSVELVSESGTPRLLSWQPERDQLWSLTYHAGSPGTHFTCDVIRKAFINVRTRKVLADEVLRYENPRVEGQLPTAPTWTWTTNTLVIRDPKRGNRVVTY